MSLVDELVDELVDKFSKDELSVDEFSVDELSLHLSLQLDLTQTILSALTLFRVCGSGTAQVLE